MLSTESADSLVSIISSATEALNTLLERFSSIFDVKNRVICLKDLSLLLTDGILDQPQQIVAFWIIYKSFEVDDIEDHPFKPLFSLLYSEFRITRPNLISPQLLTILSNLLTKNDISAIGDLSVDQIFGPDFPLRSHSPSEIQTSKIHFTRIAPLLVDNINPQSNQQNSGNDSISNHSATISSSPSLSGSMSISASPSASVMPIISHNEAVKCLLANPSYSHDFEASYIRPAPAPLEVTDAELEQSYIYSGLNVPFLFDESLTLETIQHAKQLLLNSVDKTLSPNEQRILCNTISSDQSIVEDSDLSDQQITKIIDNNPAIAICFLKANCPKKQTTSDILSKLPASPSVSEVVKSYLLSGNAPTNFLRTFCNTSISAIRDTRDQATYQKIAISFCNLLEDLIHNGITIDGTLTISINSICDDLRKRNIKEASSLQQLLHTD